MNFMKRIFTGMKQEAEPVTSVIAEEVEKSTVVSQPEPEPQPQPQRQGRRHHSLRSIKAAFPDQYPYRSPISTHSEVSGPV